MNPPDTLSSQLRELLQLAGINRPGQAELIKPRNHVWKLAVADKVDMLR